MVKTKPYSDVSSSVNKFKVTLSLCCFAFCLAVIACDNKPYITTVNGSKIYKEDYRSQLDRKIHMLPKDFLSQPDYRKRFEEEVLDGMITEKIMFLRAQELNIYITDNELEEKIKEFKKDYGKDFSDLLAQENVKYEQWKEDLKKEMLLQKLVAIDVNSKIKITDDEAEKYFNEHRNNYKTESRARVAQILVRDLALAKIIEARLKTGEDFSAVAAEVSVGPEASRGGDLGFITRQIMPEPLDKTIFSLPVNRISPIVQSSYGFYIFKVLEVQSAGIRKFKDIKGKIISDIRSQKEDAAFKNWLEALKMKAVIKKEDNMLGKE